MKDAKQKKTYLVSEEGFINVYPSLYDHKEENILKIIRRLVQELIQLRKGR